MSDLTTPLPPSSPTLPSISPVVPTTRTHTSKHNTTLGPSPFVKDPDTNNQGFLWASGIMCWECCLGWWNKKIPCGWKAEAGQLRSDASPSSWESSSSSATDSGSQGGHWGAAWREGAQLINRRSWQWFQISTVSWTDKNSTKAVH